MRAKDVLRLVDIALVSIFVASMTASSPGNSNPLEDFMVHRHVYFSQFNVLPVFPPRDERPGEVYLVPNGEFLYRWDNCFGDLIAHEYPTALATFSETHRSTLQAQAKVAATRIAKVEATNNLGFSDVVTTKFSNAVIRAFTRPEITAELTTKRDVTCHREIIKILQRDANAQITNGIPWIIQEVWYAREQTSFTTQQDVSVDVQAEIEKTIKQIDAGMQVDFMRAGEGTAAVVSTETLPIAWRPAYVSLKHYQKVKDAENRGLFDLIQEWLGLIESAPEMLLELRKQFPEELVRPNGDCGGDVDRRAHGI